MREHPVIGERILRAIPGLGCVARIVRHEHERFDGSGYPDGLAGEEIPLGSRIILACDAYHAMTSDRPYRAAHPSRQRGRRAGALRRLAVRPADHRGARGPPRSRRRRAAVHDAAALSGGGRFAAAGGVVLPNSSHRCISQHTPSTPSARRADAPAGCA